MRLIQEYKRQLRYKNTASKFENDGSFKLSWAIPTKCNIRVVPHKMYVSFFTAQDTNQTLEEKSQSSVVVGPQGLSILRNVFPEEGTAQNGLDPKQFKTNQLYNRAMSNLRPMSPRNNNCDYLYIADTQPPFIPYPMLGVVTQNTTNIKGIVRTVTFPNPLTGGGFRVEHEQDTLWVNNDVSITGQPTSGLTVVRERNITPMLTGFIYRGKAQPALYEYTVSPIANSQMFGEGSLIAEGNVLDIEKVDGVPPRLIVAKNR